MKTKAEIIERLLNPGIIAVVRAQKEEQVIPLSEALIAGGIIAIEITMTTPNAIEAIRRASAALGEKGLFGVGTILDAATAEAAIDAGAQFVVSPITRKEIAQVANRRGKPVMLGAYTPTEAQTAHEFGADFIKLFPADGLGPAYVKALRAPLPHLKIVPTGGVDLSTIEPFLKAGCVALGAGSALVSQDILSNAKWAELTSLARQWTEAVFKARSK